MPDRSEVRSQTKRAPLHLPFSGQMGDVGAGPPVSGVDVPLGACDLASVEAASHKGFLPSRGQTAGRLGLTVRARTREGRIGGARGPTLGLSPPCEPSSHAGRATHAGRVGGEGNTAARAARKYSETWAWRPRWNPAADDCNPSEVGRRVVFARTGRGSSSRSGRAGRHGRQGDGGVAASFAPTVRGAPRVAAPLTVSR